MTAKLLASWIILFFVIFLTLESAYSKSASQSPPFSSSSSNPSSYNCTLYYTNGIVTGKTCAIAQASNGQAYVYSDSAPFPGAVMTTSAQSCFDVGNDGPSISTAGGYIYVTTTLDYGGVLKVTDSPANANLYGYVAYQWLQCNQYGQCWIYTVYRLVLIFYQTGAGFMEVYCSCNPVSYVFNNVPTGYYHTSGGVYVSTAAQSQCSIFCTQPNATADFYFYGWFNWDRNIFICQWEQLFKACV
jgi:hypothetical protein